MHQSPIPSSSSHVPPASSAQGHRLPALLTAAAAGTTAVLIGTGILLNSLEATYTAVSVLWIVVALVSAVLMLAVCWLLARSRVEREGPAGTPGSGGIALLPALLATVLVVQEAISTIGTAALVVMTLAMPTDRFFPASATSWSIRTAFVVLMLLVVAAIALVTGLRGTPGRRPFPVPLSTKARAVILLGALGAAVALAALPWLVVGISRAAQGSLAMVYVTGLGENLAILLVVAAGLLLAARADGLLRWAAPSVLALLQLSLAAGQLLLAIRYAQVVPHGPSDVIGGVLEFAARAALPLAVVVGAAIVGALLALGQGRAARPLPSADGAAS